MEAAAKHDTETRLGGERSQSPQILQQVFFFWLDRYNYNGISKCFAIENRSSGQLECYHREMRRGGGVYSFPIIIARNRCSRTYANGYGYRTRYTG